MRLKTTRLILILILFFSKSQSQYPQFNVTAHTAASKGYYFFCPYTISGFPYFPPGTQNQMVLDRNGHVVYYRPVDGYFAGDFKQQPNGLISSVGQGQFMLMDSTFTVVDSVSPQNGVMFDLHDLRVLSNGHYLLLGDEYVNMDLSSYNLFYNNGTPGSANAVVVAGVVQELDANKNVVFEWHAKDHFNFADADPFFLTDSANVDWTHMNAVETDSDGNILISSRHFDEITKINRSDSSIIWRMGGNANQFTFVNDTIKFLSQHNIRRLPNGNITIFDNGRATTPIHPAIAKEYQLDEVNHIATLVWYHMESDTVFSTSQGNVQRLDNGNTMICYGSIINENIVFNVIDSSGNKVFEVAFPDTQISYRSFNFDTLSWLFNQPHITCYSDSGNYYLVADSGYSSYRWSTGDSTQSIPVMINDTFYVYVPVNNNGFISSDMFIVTDSLDPCGINGIHDIARKNIKIFPNPVSDKIHLQFADGNKPNGVIEIFDNTGRKVMSLNNTKWSDDISIDVHTLNAGLYYIRMNEYGSKFIKE